MKAAMLSLVIALLAFHPWSYVDAAEPQATVSATANVTLLVNGTPAKTLPASVALGSRVCVKTLAEYLNAGERYHFESWDIPEEMGQSGHTLEGPCTDVLGQGTYTAQYSQQVLFQVRSEVKTYRRSWWVPKGDIVELSVPDVVDEADTTRYRFKEWSAGETPFNASNLMVALEPTTVEVFWTPEYNVIIEGPDGSVGTASGWYSGGSSLVLRATPEIYGDRGRSRLSFDTWEALAGPLPSVRDGGSPATIVTVDGHYVFHASYETAFLVEAGNFQGILLQEWILEGQEVEIESPATIETIPEKERYIFKGWRGENIGEEANTLRVIVDRPLSLEALYDKQFMVNVSSPYGASGSGWYTEGEKAMVMAPEEPQSMLFFKRVFAGFLGYEGSPTPADRPVTTVEVDRPLNISATYRTELNRKVLAIIVGTMVTGTLVYVLTQWGPAIYRRLQGPVRTIRQDTSAEQSQGGACNKRHWAARIRGRVSVLIKWQTPKKDQTHASANILTK